MAETENAKGGTDANLTHGRTLAPGVDGDTRRAGTRGGRSGHPLLCIGSDCKDDNVPCILRLRRGSLGHGHPFATPVCTNSLTASTIPVSEKLLALPNRLGAINY